LELIVLVPLRVRSAPDSWLTIPPPRSSALFPLTVESIRVSVPPKFQMPPAQERSALVQVPPPVATFPLTAESMSVIVPKSESMPPELLAVFPLTVEFSRVSVPSSTSMPPPKTPDAFPVTRELTT